VCVEGLGDGGGIADSFTGEFSGCRRARAFVAIDCKKDTAWLEAGVEVESGGRRLEFDERRELGAGNEKKRAGEGDTAEGEATLEVEGKGERGMGIDGLSEPGAGAARCPALDNAAARTATTVVGR